MKKTSRCFPSHQTIADELGFTIKTVQRAIKELENAGFIIVQRENGRSRACRYSFGWSNEKVDNTVHPSTTNQMQTRSTPSKKVDRVVHGNEPSAINHKVTRDTALTCDSKLNLFLEVYPKTGVLRVITKAWEFAIKAGADPDEIVEAARI